MIYCKVSETHDSWILGLSAQQLQYAVSDVHSPASSRGPGQAGQARPGQSHSLTTALAWPKIFESQSRRLRPRLLSEFFAL